MIVLYALLALCALVQAATATDVPHGLLYTALWLLWGLLTVREGFHYVIARRSPPHR